MFIPTKRTTLRTTAVTGQRVRMKTALLALSLIALPAIAQVTPQAETVTESQAGLVTKTSTVRASAVITHIDKKTRKLTLKKPDGQMVEVIAGSEVRNFDQIKVSDTVNVEYVNSLTLDLKKPGETASASASELLARAEPGQKPGGVAASTVTIVAEVIDADPTRKTVTLRGPKGKIVVLDVNNPDQFKVVKRGDKIEATYSEAVAIAVEPAEKKAIK